MLIAPSLTRAVQTVCSVGNIFSIIRRIGSTPICGKRRVDGNQTILVWRALASKRRHIRDMGPELEALVTFAALHKSAMNRRIKSAFIF